MEKIVMNPKGETMAEVFGISKERGVELVKEVQSQLDIDNPEFANNHPDVLQNLLDHMLTFATDEAERAMVYIAVSGLVVKMKKIEMIRKMRNELANAFLNHN